MEIRIILYGKLYWTMVKSFAYKWVIILLL